MVTVSYVPGMCKALALSRPLSEAMDLNARTGERLRKDVSGLDYEAQLSSLTPGQLILRCRKDWWK